MADVTGPCSTLPGASHVVPDGMMCDDHPDRPATHRIQGETDSFGAELNDMCDECHTSFKEAMVKYREESRHGTCDWCKNPASDLRDKRDYEEGLSGPVYRVCGGCVRRENERLQDELDDDDYY
jgi:hypothetical protein